MKNSLVDVHNLLMEQLQRINEAETDEEIQKETEKAKTMSSIAKVIVDNANVMLDAAKLKAEYTGNTEMPNLLEG